MAGLIYKELILQKRNLIVISIALLLLLALLFFPAGSDYLGTLSSSLCVQPKYLVVVWEMMIYLFVFLLVGMYQSTIFEEDESKKWAGFISSTPLTGAGQIGAKYYFTLLMSVLTLALLWCFDYISAVVYHGDFYLQDVAVSLFYIQLFLRAFEYPYLVRFGSKNGSTYKGILFLFVVLAAVIYFLFGDLSAFGSVNDLIDSLFKMIAGKNTSEIMLVLRAVFPYLSVALYYLSYRVSCRFYMKGVDIYDK